MLRAMGYTAQTTDQGPDYGVDAIAHPDALGFEEPQVNNEGKRGSMARLAGTPDQSNEGPEAIAVT